MNVAKRLTGTKGSFAKDEFIFADSPSGYKVSSSDLIILSSVSGKHAWCGQVLAVIMVRGWGNTSDGRKSRSNHDRRKRYFQNFKSKFWRFDIFTFWHNDQFFLVI
jgi:hypothetical protein